MNKNRRQLDARVRKKLNKNVRLGQNAFAKKAPPLTTDDINAELLLKKYPSKLRLQLKEELDSELKRMAVKKKVKTTSYHSHSKRTTPGEVEGRDSTPAHCHPESAKWDKNLKLQSKVKNREFSKKTLKRK